MFDGDDDNYEKEIVAGQILDWKVKKKKKQVGRNVTKACVCMTNSLFRICSAGKDSNRTGSNGYLK